jgi:hypothetical protein
MGAGGDDFFNRVAIERFDICFGQSLVEILVADPACRIARALFFGSENGEFDFRFFQNARKRAQDLLIAIVLRARATNPE